MNQEHNKNKLSLRKENKITENPDILDESYFGQTINEGNHIPFGKIYDNINCQGLPTNIENKIKPLFNIEHTKTLTTTFITTKIEIDFNNSKKKEKEKEKPINEFLYNIPKMNFPEEENLIDTNFINNINKNHSYKLINKSIKNELEFFFKIKSDYKEIKLLEKKSNSTNSLSDSYNFLESIYNKTLENQKLENELKYIYETNNINKKYNDLISSDNNIFAYFCLKNINTAIIRIIRKNFKIFKLPKYLKNKNTNISRFYENGVKRSIAECSHSIHNVIINLSKKYIKIYKLNIKKQLKCSIRDFQLFFDKPLKEIYFDILPKKIPSIYKNDREKGKIDICEKIKRQISFALNEEKKDKNVKIKKLNKLFDEKTTFWLILEAFINDKNTIILNNENENNENEEIILEGFSTLKDCLFPFKTNEKDEIRIRITMIKEGKVKMRNPRAKNKR